MSKPSHADSQRIVSLLDEMNHRLEVLSCLTEENFFTPRRIFKVS